MIDEAGARDLLIKRWNVSRETIARLETYESLLMKWNKAINLVSKEAIDKVWARHFLDSAQLWDMRPEKAKSWVDLGAGGGFPGMVIAILAAEAGGPKVTLIESDGRKAAFLAKVALDTGLSPNILISRSESAPPQNADVVSARAMAPLDQLLAHAARHLAPTGTGLFLKGEKHESELTQARKTWDYQVEIQPSLVDPGGVILRIGGLKRV